MSGADAAEEARSYGRSASMLTVAFGIAGGLVYLYFALASHNLDPDEYGRLVVLWTVVYVIAVTVFRPVEQFLAHALARPAAHPGEQARLLRVAAALQAGLAGACIVAVLALRTPLEEDLIEGETEFAVLLASLATLAGWFLVRGLFAGLRRFGPFAAVVVAEAVVRFALALALAVGLSDDRDIVVVAIAVAPLASMVVLPLWLLRRRSPDRLRGPAAMADTPGAARGARAHLFEGGAFAGALLVILLCEQVILSAGPLFVQGAEGAAAAALAFNLLMVARAPLLLFQAVATSMLPHLTRMWSRGTADGTAEFRRSLRGTLLAVAGFAAALTVFVLAVGPGAMQLAFGDAYEYGRLELVAIGVATGLYLSAVALNQAVLAQGQVRVAAFCWAGAAGVFAIVNVIPGIDPLTRMEIGLLGVSGLLCAVLLVITRRPHARREDVIAPGSERELETQLAEEL